MLKFCIDAKKYLDQDPKNVVIVHCKAGKGRTGSMCCALLLYMGAAKSAKEAIHLYAEKRTVDKKGITVRSQTRYIQYFEKYLAGDRMKDAQFAARTLKEIRLYNVINTIQSLHENLYIGIWTRTTKHTPQKYVCTCQYLSKQQPNLGSVHGYVEQDNIVILKFDITNRNVRSTTTHSTKVHQPENISRMTSSEQQPSLNAYQDQTELQKEVVRESIDQPIDLVQQRKPVQAPPSVFENQAQPNVEQSQLLTQSWNQQDKLESFIEEEPSQAIKNNDEASQNYKTAMTGFLSPNAQSVPSEDDHDYSYKTSQDTSQHVPLQPHSFPNRISHLNNVPQLTMSSPLVGQIPNSQNSQFKPDGQNLQFNAQLLEVQKVKLEQQEGKKGDQVNNRYKRGYQYKMPPQMVGPGQPQSSDKLQNMHSTNKSSIVFPEDSAEIHVQHPDYKDSSQMLQYVGRRSCSGKPEKLYEETLKRFELEQRMQSQHEQEQSQQQYLIKQVHQNQMSQNQNLLSQELGQNPTTSSLDIQKRNIQTKQQQQQQPQQQQQQQQNQQQLIEQTDHPIRSNSLSYDSFLEQKRDIEKAYQDELQQTTKSLGALNKLEDRNAQPEWRTLHDSSQQKQNQQKQGANIQSGSIHERNNNQQSEIADQLYDQDQQPQGSVQNASEDAVTPSERHSTKTQKGSKYTRGSKDTKAYSDPREKMDSSFNNYQQHLVAKDNIRKIEGDQSQGMPNIKLNQSMPLDQVDPYIRFKIENAMQSWKSKQSQTAALDASNTGQKQHKDQQHLPLKKTSRTEDSSSGVQQTRLDNIQDYANPDTSQGHIPQKYRNVEDGNLSVKSKKQSKVEQVGGCELVGDVRIAIFRNELCRQPLFNYWINMGFLEQPNVVADVMDLDKPLKPLQRDFRMELILGDLLSAPSSDTVAQDLAQFWDSEGCFISPSSSPQATINEESNIDVLTTQSSAQSDFTQSDTSTLTVNSTIPTPRQTFQIHHGSRKGAGSQSREQHFEFGKNSQIAYDRNYLDSVKSIFKFKAQTQEQAQNNKQGYIGARDKVVS